MEKAEALLKSGELDDCMTEVMAAVRTDGGAVAPRVFLFQLFCLFGDWERARRQLYILKDMDASTVPMFETYDQVIQCEHLRNAVFSGKRSPLFFGKPEQWLADLAAAVQALAEGRTEEAVELRDRAFESAPESSGTIDGEAFEWLADADGRLGPVLEVYLNGHYYWVPMSYVAAIEIDEPEDLRDLVWMPAQFRWVNQGQAVGFIPARYPGIEQVTDPRLRQSRLTEWEELDETLVIGHGQRTLVSDKDDHPLLGIREIRFDNESAEIETPDTGPAAG